MPQLVRFEGRDGSFMVVETMPVIDESRFEQVGAGEGEPAKAIARLEDALGSVQGAAVAFMATVEELRRRDADMVLDEVSMDVALSFGAEGGVIVAKGSVRAEASVRLTWRAKDDTG